MVNHEIFSNAEIARTKQMHTPEAMPNVSTLTVKAKKDTGAKKGTTKVGTEINLSKKSATKDDRLVKPIANENKATNKSVKTATVSAKDVTAKTVPLSTTPPTPNPATQTGGKNAKKSAALDSTTTRPTATADTQKKGKTDYADITKAAIKDDKLVKTADTKSSKTKTDTTAKTSVKTKTTDTKTKTDTATKTSVKSADVKKKKNEK